MIFRTAGQSGYDTRMTKLLLLYYSMYGHIEIMAGAIAEGACRRGRSSNRQARSGIDVVRGRQEIWREAGPERADCRAR